MKITKSSGDVFADLRLPVPEERLAKAKLAAQIARVIAGADAPSALPPS